MSPTTPWITAFLYFVPCLLMLSTGSRADVAPGQWWREPFTMFQTNLRQIDVDMDIAQTLDFLQDFGASAWLLNVGGILAYYPTDLPFQIRNPFLAERQDSDFIAEAVNASHTRGMRLLGRMDFSKVQLEVGDEHPEWLFVSPTGDRQTHANGLVSVCPSGQWYQERVFDILNEVTSRYELDGFFVNWAGYNEQDYWKVYHGVCHCDSCKSRWADYSNGLELPNRPQDANYLLWQEFTASVIDDWTARVRDSIKKNLPDAGLILGQNADITFHEANNAVERELWYYLTSESVSSIKSHRPETPTLCNGVSFVDMPYRMGSEEPLHFAQYLLQCISRGGNPSTYIMGTPGKIPYRNMEIASNISSFFLEWSEVYSGLSSVAQTGLVMPDRGQIDGEYFENATSEYKGIYTALQELHIPFDVVGQEFLAELANSTGLERYKVLILPDLSKLRSEDVDAIDQWVAAGGSLISTGSSGIDQEGSVQLQSLPSQREKEVAFDQQQLFSTYYAPAQNRTQDDIYTGAILPIHGVHRLFDWKEVTGSRYKLLAFAPFAPPEYAYGNRQVDEPGCGIGTFGNGTGIVIPFTIGRSYHELGLRVYRDFLELILEEDSGRSEKLGFNLAEQVEVTVNSNGLSTVVHLINMSGGRHQNFGAHLPIPAGTINVSGRNVTAHALTTDTFLKVEGGTIQLPELDLYEVLLIEGLE